MFSAAELIFWSIGSFVLGCVITAIFTYRDDKPHPDYRVNEIDSSEMIQAIKKRLK